MVLAVLAVEPVARVKRRVVDEADRDRAPLQVLDRRLDGLGPERDLDRGRHAALECRGLDGEVLRQKDADVVARRAELLAEGSYDVGQASRLAERDGLTGR